MIPKIDTETKVNTSPQVNVTIEQRPATQKTVNSILMVSAVLILIAVVASYFLRNLGSIANVSLTELTSGGIWLAIGCYAVSTLIKQISINRAKLTKEYIEAKKEADKKLKKYADDGLLVYAKEYCQAYEEETLTEDRKRILAPVGIDFDIFLQKYLAKSFLYLLFKDKTLSFKQRIAISKANHVKRTRYNPDFLRSTVRVKNRKSPSESNDTDRKNTIDNVRSFISSMFGGAFAVSIASDIVFAFSTEALIAAGIKLAVIIMTSAMRASFGWRLITETEVGRLELQASEAVTCIKWSAKKYPVYFQGKEIPKEREDDE